MANGPDLLGSPYSRAACAPGRTGGAGTHFMSPGVTTVWSAGCWVAVWAPAGATATRIRTAVAASAAWVADFMLTSLLVLSSAQVSATCPALLLSRTKMRRAGWPGSFGLDEIRAFCGREARGNQARNVARRGCGRRTNLGHGIQPAALARR